MKNVRIIFLISMLITVITMIVVAVMIFSETGIKIGETNLKEMFQNEDTRGILFMPLVLLIVGLSMIPFYRLMFPMKIKNGVQTRAKVLEVNDTGVTINDDPQVKLKLELRTQEGLQMEVEAKTLVSRLSVGNLQPGIFANVIYDPLKPQRVKIVSLEEAEQPSPAEERVEERPPSATERLLELNDLKARGLVTEQEYQTKRTEILKNL